MKNESKTTERVRHRRLARPLRRGLWATFAGTATASFLVMLGAAPANAYVLLPCRWSSSNVQLWAPAVLTYQPDWANAATRWNGLDAHFTVNSSSPWNVRAGQEARGNTVSWSGVTRKIGTVSTFPSCSGGHWVSQQMEVILNSSYVGSYSSDKRRGVATHELGHAFGLNENPGSAAVVMYPNDSRTTTYPASDDKAGVNAYY